MTICSASLRVGSARHPQPDGMVKLLNEKSFRRPDVAETAMRVPLS